MKGNKHPWMHSYFVVVKCLYATADEQGFLHLRKRGTRENCTVTAWQEESETQNAKVIVSAGKYRPTSRSKPSEKSRAPRVHARLLTAASSRLRAQVDL
jgi:hypothetical protein